MNQSAKSCYLVSEDKMLTTVHIPNQKNITLGRCPETNITDTKCSKEQVQLFADYQEYKLFVQQLGKRPCGFNGFMTRKDVKFVGKHEDRLEMLYGKYGYRIEFNPPPPKTVVSEKRSRESKKQDDTEESCTKVLKLDPVSSNANIKENCIEEEQNPKAKKTAKNAGTLLNFIQKNKVSSDKLIEDNSSLDLDNESGMWENRDNGALLIYTTNSIESRSKIAAYDMDGTLIKTKSGLVFPKDHNDWQLLYPQVPAKLKELYSDGYKIVIFTNQASIGSGRIDVKNFKMKLMNIVAKISVPIQIFIATGNNIYRKPAIGMWQKLEEKNGGIPIDKDSSFYVGDAAGRAKNWAPGRKKDHSLVDRLLALNLGLQFYTPEEHFLGHKQAPHVLPTFNPKNLPNIDICLGGEIASDAQEIILMVGSPGSGKSHFVRNYLSCYGYVNRDTLGSWQKCVSVMEKYITERKSVVVDNTNPDSTSRKRYIEVAKKYDVPVRCFSMLTSIEHAKHNNKFRELTDPSHAKVSEIIINSYVKHFQPPSLDEGFAEIVHINCVPKFEKEEQRQLYEMYLLEA